MSRTIKIPLLGIETNVNKDATEKDIIEAVSEASVAFCIASTEDGQGIKKELELVNQDFKIACKEIAERISNLPYENGDVSDIGNEIGMVLGKYIAENSFGWEEDDFISGLNHGISIANGTH
jgi:hypothetical protein